MKLVKDLMRDKKGVWWVTMNSGHIDANHQGAGTLLVDILSLAEEVRKYCRVMIDSKNNDVLKNFLINSFREQNVVYVFLSSEADN